MAEDFEDDFEDPDLPSRPIGVACRVPCKNSVEMRLLSELRSEECLQVDVPFFEDDEDASQKPEGEPDAADEARFAIVAYYHEMIALARSLGPDASEAMFKDALKREGWKS